MTQHLDYRSNGYNHLDKLHMDFFSDAIAAGYHPKIAAVIAYRATREHLYNRVYGFADTSTDVESGFEHKEDSKFLAHYQAGEETESVSVYHFPYPPNDPFHWQTKSILEYLENASKTILEPDIGTPHPAKNLTSRFPSAPRFLSAAMTKEKVTLKWNPPLQTGFGGPITGYNIWRYQKTWTRLIGNTDSTDTTFVDEPYTDRNYWYCLRAINRAGPGEWSTVEMARLTLDY